MTELTDLIADHVIAPSSSSRARRAWVGTKNIILDEDRTAHDNET